MLKLLILVAGQGHLKVLEIIQKVIRNFCGPHSDEIKDEGKRRLDDFISSLDRKVIDIDVFDSCLNKVYLITTE